jgi:hypothetical protein
MSKPKEIKAPKAEGHLTCRTTLCSTCVGTVSASLMAGRQPAQSALLAAVAGKADRKLLMGLLAADSAASSPVMLMMAPRRCSRAVLWESDEDG